MFGRTNTGDWLVTLLPLSRVFSCDLLRRNMRHSVQKYLLQTTKRGTKAARQIFRLSFRGDAEHRTRNLEIPGSR
jgi:hypothetical protein